ncbi:hypothetical protein IE9_02650 [Bacillus cereus BAG4X12-1]|nr:hypothetical protein IE9_02650 [Bacillus cereus BAG4X12-1]EOP84403.1 hypothetical protein IEG_01905 [Bacillus cereus BAG5X12-1]
MDEVQLREWLYKMGSGDQEAFQIIYEYTCKDIYRTVVFLVGSQNQDVDDIVNEVYINMWKSITNYDINRSFRFWLHGLVVKEVQYRIGVVNRGDDFESLKKRKCMNKIGLT